MKIFSRDQKHGRYKVSATSQEDLWLLSQLISKGAICGAHTSRKIKISETKVDKKTFYIEILAENIEYENEHLRISGKSISELEEVPKGSYHSLTVALYEELNVQQKWLKFQLDKLEESTKEAAKVLLVALDRSEVFFAKVEQDSYKLISRFEGDVSRKAYNTKEKGNFYSDIEKTLLEYLDRFKLDRIILASPAFFKEDMYKQIKDERLKKIITLATCSSVSETCFNEILKREEVKSALEQFRARQELVAVDELFVEIAKDGKYSYGFQDVSNNVASGAVVKILVTTNIISKKREDGSYGILEALMSSVEDSNGKVIIVDSENEGGKKLDGIGGIGGILRYKKY